MRAVLVLTLVLLSGLAPGQVQLHVFEGIAAQDALGGAVAGAGDVNGDGIADLIAGARYEDTAGNNAGAARVFSGSDGVELLVLPGSEAGDLYGTSVAGCGDVNDDGHDDLVVGGIYADAAPAGRGLARVHSGADGTVIHTWSGDADDDFFGHAVAGVGDVNGDGVPDVAVGAPQHDGSASNAGRVKVFSGFDGSVLLTLDGGMANAKFGWSVAGAGDLNGDGRGDIIVGAVLDSSAGTYAGRAQAFSGADGSLLLTIDGGAAGDWLGWSVAGVGDQDGDGVPDVAVGAPKVGAGQGAATVHSGVDGTLIRILAASGSGSLFGQALAAAGDVDGDGHQDIVVGAPGPAGSGSGHARICSGQDGSPLHDFEGATAGDNLGRAVAGAGDVDGDGFPDVVLGAPGFDGGGLADCGAVIVHGSLQPPLVVSGPTQVVIGTNLPLELATNPALAWTPYLFDISLAGSAPGLPLPGGTLPLNWPLLHLAYGSLVPTLFTGFTGLTGADGLATAGFLVPWEPALVGLTVSASALTLDPQAAFGIGLVGTGVDVPVRAPQATLLSITPDTGPTAGGNVVTITGSGFLTGLQVTFGTTTATGLTVLGPALLTCIAPGGAPGPVSVVVAHPGGTPSAPGGPYTYVSPNPPPILQRVAPPTGPVSGGFRLLLSGDAFLPGVGITVGGTAATDVTVVDARTLTCVAPAGPLGPANVGVMNPDGQGASLAGAYAWIPDLTLTGISPLLPEAGVQVTVTGAGHMAGLTLEIDGVPVVPLSITQTEIVFTMPSGVACDVTLRALNPSGQEATLGFNPGPIITGTAFASGPASGGTSFFVFGQDFRPNSTVTVGGAPATVSTASATTLVIVTPPGNPGPAAVEVMTPGGCTASTSFLYLP